MKKKSMGAVENLTINGCKVRITYAPESREMETLQELMQESMRQEVSRRI